MCENVKTTKHKKTTPNFFKKPLAFLDSVIWHLGLQNNDFVVSNHKDIHELQALLPMMVFFKFKIVGCSFICLANDF